MYSAFATVLLLISSQYQQTSANYDKFYNIRSTYYFPAEGEKGNFDFAAQRCKDLGSGLVRIENSMELHDIVEYIEIRFNNTRNTEAFWTGAYRLDNIDYAPDTYWSWNGKHPIQRVPYTCIRWCHGFPKMGKENDALKRMIIHKDEYSWCAKNSVAEPNYYFICEKRVVLKL